jgi:hypothetical protein
MLCTARPVASGLEVKRFAAGAEVSRTIRFNGDGPEEHPRILGIGVANPRLLAVCPPCLGKS